MKKKLSLFTEAVAKPRWLGYFGGWFWIVKVRLARQSLALISSFWLFFSFLPIFLCSWCRNGFLEASIIPYHPQKQLDAFYKRNHFHSFHFAEGKSVKIDFGKKWGQNFWALWKYRNPQEVGSIYSHWIPVWCWFCEWRWRVSCPQKGSALAVWWDRLKPDGHSPEPDWRGIWITVCHVPSHLLWHICLTLFGSILRSLEIILQQSLGNHRVFFCGVINRHMDF